MNEDKPTAVVTLQIRSNTGYAATDNFAGVTPEQYGEACGVLNGNVDPRRMRRLLQEFKRFAESGQSFIYPAGTWQELQDLLK